MSERGWTTPTIRPATNGDGRILRGKAPDQVVPFTMRVNTEDANDFIAWCEANRLTYREGFAKLVARIEGHN